MSVKFKHSATYLLSGPTGSGKTTFIKQFLQQRNDLIDTYIEDVIYCLPEGQIVNYAIPFTKLHRGVPDISMFHDLKPRIVILDDLLSNVDSNVVELFIRGSHHFNLSVIFVVQNLFSKNKGCREISLNSHVIVLFSNPRDKQQISILARQISPENPRFITEAFTDATIKPFGYLVLDSHQLTPEQYRIRTNIFSNDSPRNIVYIPLKNPK